MIDFTIKKMSEIHLDEVFDLEKNCFSVPWSMQSLKESLKSNDTNFFVVVNKNENVFGYIGFYRTIKEGYITNLAVLPKYRRLGIAKSLLNFLVKFGKRNDFDFFSLEVRESNLSAILLYKSVGFLTVGVRKNFYSFPKEDALIMTKYLKDCKRE